jgi:hypothetical protein
MKFKWMAISLLVSLSSQAYATLIYDGNNTYQINSTIFEDIRLQNGADLDVIQGGFIQPATDMAAITRSGFSGSSTVRLSGDSTVVGGIHYENWGNEDDAVIASGNAQILAQGEMFSGFGRGAVSGARLVEVSGSAHLAGADNLSNGGNAINNSTSGGILAEIHGGEVVGGDGGEIGGNGIDGWIEVVGLDMSDGVVEGGDGNNLGGHGIYSDGSIGGAISGGLICGGDSSTTGGDAIFSRGGVSLDISGGSFQGGNNGSLGGNAIKSSGDSGAHTMISGGQFDAGSGLLDDGWLLNLTGQGHHFEISGGLFGYDNIGRGFGVFNDAIVDVHGWDLELNNNLLTGYLLDGSWIETTVTLTQNNYYFDGILNIINYGNPNDPEPPNASVPEPGSLMLLLIGVTGTWATRQRKRRPRTTAFYHPSLTVLHRNATIPRSGLSLKAGIFY